MAYDRFSDPVYIKWARKVKKRDNFTCQVCGKTNVHLHTHHRNSWDMFVEQRFDVLNGITLCNLCHERFHEIYGAGQNTECQFDEYCRMANLIHKVARQHLKESK